MKYILEEEELDKLIDKKEVMVRDYALDWARETILTLANYKCVEEVGDAYCDCCPVSNIGSNMKEYCGDKIERPEREVSELLCRRIRHYSK